MCIDFLRCGIVGVAEDELRLTGRRIDGIKKRPLGMAHVMHLDEPYAVPQTDAMKRAHEVSRLNRPSGLRREDQSIISAGCPPCCARHLMRSILPSTLRPNQPA